MFRSLAAALVLAATAASAQPAPSGGSSAPPPGPPPTLRMGLGVQGEILFDATCAGCHVRQGEPSPSAGRRRKRPCGSFRPNGSSRP